MRCTIGVAVLLLGAANLAAAPQEPEQVYCRKAMSDIQHGDSLTRACEFALTLQRKLPNIICQRTLKSYAGGSAFQTVTAEVTHEEGRDSYSNIKRNGKPFTDPAHLPGSWTEGEFGSALSFLFAEETHTRFKFDKETKWHSTEALLFDFELAAEDNHGYSVEANEQRVLPGFKGKLWIEASSAAVLRLEMRADKLQEAVKAKGLENMSVQRRSLPPKFILDSAKIEVDYANQLLGDGTQFVLPTTSEGNKCTIFGTCFRDQVKFENCHKFGAKARMVDEQPQQ